MTKIADVLNRTKPFLRPAALPVPEYTGTKSNGIMMAVQSMKDHMTNEGWELALGLEHAGYTLVGHGIPYHTGKVHANDGLTSTSDILELLQPGVVVLQDRREWDGDDTNFRDICARFHETWKLNSAREVFKLTVLKDAHQNPAFHRDAAAEMGCHAWIIYYHPTIVSHLATYVRTRHLIRTYHSIDPKSVPQFLPGKQRLAALLSGAVSTAYPLRNRIRAAVPLLPQLSYLAHPGYHRNGCHTPQYMQMLNQFKVAMCTASKYGYALRKIIEATACGCVVITDLPQEDKLPGIDDNLIRIDSTISISQLNEILKAACSQYDENKQEHFAQEAKTFYDYRAVGKRLVRDIEKMRLGYK